MGKRVNTAVWMEKHNRWQIKVQKDGVRKTFYSSTPGRTGQREANKKADQWLDENIDRSGLRVQELYTEFFESQKKTTSRGNWVNVESIGRVWILPEIGAMKIGRVNEQHLQNIIDKACQKRRSKKTVMNIRAVIMAFFKWCRKSKASTLVPENLHIPKSVRYKGKHILTPDDLKKLFSIDTTIYRGKIVHDNLINAYRFQVLLGLRPGELIGLRWDDIHGTYLKTSGPINKFGETTAGKNENAIRTIGISDKAKEILEAQRKMSQSEFVFGELSQDNYYESWKRYCRANDIEYVTPYELRHTFVSIVKSLPEGDVKAVVGHSKNMDTFGIYGHMLEGDLERIAEEIEGKFSGLLE